MDITILICAIAMILAAAFLSFKTTKKDCADSGGHIGDLAGKSACKVRFNL